MVSRSSFCKISQIVISSLSFYKIIATNSMSLVFLSNSETDKLASQKNGILVFNHRIVFVFAFIITSAEFI